MDCVRFESCGEEGLWEVSSDHPLLVSSCQGPTEKGSPAGQALDLVERGFRVLEVEVFEDHRSRSFGSRYETVSSSICSSPLCSVFGWPLLSGGPSSLGDYHGHEEMGDIEPLRVVSADGIEWGEKTSEALTDADLEIEGRGNLSEEGPKTRSECLGYDNWEDNFLIKFSEFLGIPTVGYDEEILELLRKMVSQQPGNKRKGHSTESRIERELRKLECTINYSGKGQNKGGRDRGNFLLKLKLISWNVRGANNPDKRNIIRNFIRSQRVDLVCLQETKIQEMSAADARSLGVGRLVEWKVVEAEGNAGGILVFGIKESWR